MSRPPWKFQAGTTDDGQRKALTFVIETVELIAIPVASLKMATEKFSEL